MCFFMCFAYVFFWLDLYAPGSMHIQIDLFVSIEGLLWCICFNVSSKDSSNLHIINFQIILGMFDLLIFINDRTFDDLSDVKTWTVVRYRKKCGARFWESARHKTWIQCKSQQNSHDFNTKVCHVAVWKNEIILLNECSNLQYRWRKLCTSNFQPASLVLPKKSPSW